jgi:hypothetical protein
MWRQDMATQPFMSAIEPMLPLLTCISRAYLLANPLFSDARQRLPPRKWQIHFHQAKKGALAPPVPGLLRVAMS